MKNHWGGCLAITILSLTLLGCNKASDSKKLNWRQTLKQELPRMGHRNFIVIADSAYPLQSAEGIKTIYTSESQIAIVKEVLTAIDRSQHVQPVIYLDQELSEVKEEDAKGVEQYRTTLQKIIGQRSVKRLPHTDIIKKLDQSAKMYRVLVLKTDLAIPYTSVFIELDCGYWDATREKKLREAIGK